MIARRRHLPPVLQLVSRICASLTIGFAMCAAVDAWADESPPLVGERFIDNGQIRLGVDLSLGGAITYLATTQDATNVVNDWDFGRQIQLSFYSGPVPFNVGDKRPSEHWRHIGWNPIQAGDCYDHGGKTLEFKSDGASLYLKCMPMQWPLDNVPGECTFESWLRLDGATVQARGRLNNARSDTRQYPARHQELPALYTNGPLYRLMTYRGPNPFQGEALDQIIKPTSDPAPWARWQATEHWAALVRDDNWGLGVWTPGCQEFSGGFAGKPGSGGAHDNPTGYIAPNHTETIDHNIQYEFEYTLILGKLDEIRRYVYEHAKRGGLPHWRFAHDRQHWRAVNAIDAGWPLENEWRVRLESDDPQLVAPAGCWQAAAAPKLLIEAAYRTSERKSRVYWQRFDDAGLSETRTLTFPIQGDGEFRVYEVNLAAAPDYNGTIIGLRIDPTSSGAADAEIRVRSIRLAGP